MMNYIHIPTESIPMGRTALVLFVDHDELCAGIIEHSFDGRFHRRVPENPSPLDVIPVICSLMTRSPADELYVVLEQNAYWPEQFPALQNIPRTKAASIGIK